jgi:hypothetical protein
VSVSERVDLRGVKRGPYKKSKNKSAKKAQTQLNAAPARAYMEPPKVEAAVQYYTQQPPASEPSPQPQARLVQPHKKSKKRRYILNKRDNNT